MISAHHAGTFLSGLAAPDRKRRLRRGDRTRRLGRAEIRYLREQLAGRGIVDRERRARVGGNSCAVHIGFCTDQIGLVEIGTMGGADKHGDS